MSNKIDHDILSEKINKAFNLATDYLTAKKILEDQQLLQEYKIGNADISLNEKNLIHIGVNGEDTLSIYKNIDTRETKIMQHKEGDELPYNVAVFNTCDDPLVSVFVGKNESEKNKILEKIDNASITIQKELDRIMPQKKNKRRM
jgi:hypothetical protein